MMSIFYLNVSASRRHRQQAVPGNNHQILVIFESESKSTYIYICDFKIKNQDQLFRLHFIKF